jgi:hypothetical protein
MFREISHDKIGIQEQRLLESKSMVTTNHDFVLTNTGQLISE